MLVGMTIATASTASAQDFRGTITGQINDSSGGRLPGAVVTATNAATNLESSTTTNGEGEYTIAYLTAGKYAVTVEMQGFKKLVRDGIEVRVGDRLKLDLILEVGQMEETVSVTAESPLLETGSASAGQVIDEKRISLMPLSDGNPFVLSRIVPGIAYTGDLLFSRPFDNGGTSSIVADGASGGNEFSLDGSPNMANGRRVAFVPPAGAVQEFKVETATFDAADGHSAGALVNVTLKSGTNLLKGESYFYLRDDKLSATDFFVNRSNSEKPALDVPPVRRQRRRAGAAARLQRPGPHLLLRRHRVALRRVPGALSQTVPTEAMRNGDFSALLAQGITIYDPNTARQQGTLVVRDPFPGNIIPANRINQVARNVLELLPDAEPGWKRAGTEQLLLHEPAHGRFLLNIDTRGSPADRQAADLRALHAQRSHRGAQRVVRRRSTAPGRVATS